MLYLPLPVFWALFDQQGSRWTFQATRLNGDIGFYDIKPDQMQVINPFLILTFIPLFEAVFYPLLSKIGIRRPLQKLTIGGILAGIAFLLSAAVEFELEKTYPVLPEAGEAQLRLYNGFKCEYKAVSNTKYAENFTLKALQGFEQKHISVHDKMDFVYTFNRVSGTDCPEKIESKIMLNETTAWGLFISKESLNIENQFLDNPDKSSTGQPNVRFLINSKNPDAKFALVTDTDKQNEEFNTKINDQTLRTISSGKYRLLINDKIVSSVEFKQGGVYTIIGNYESDGQFEFNLFEVATPNTMSMLWLTPQYVVMTLGPYLYIIFLSDEFYNNFKFFLCTVK